MQNSATKKPKSLFPLLAVMLFDHTSLNITFPVLTLLFFDAQSSFFSADTSHAVRSMWYGLCVAVPHIVNIVVTPILSMLSDVYGRKKILLVGTLGAFLFAVTGALGIIWGMLSLLFLGRVIQGAFSRTNPIAQAVVGDISTGNNKVRYMGYLQLAISIGAFIGPVMGGYGASPMFIKHFNFSLPYLIAAGFAAISCLVTWFFFQETLPAMTSPLKRFGAIKNVIKNKKVLRISVVLLLSQISWSMYYQFIPPTLKTVLGFNAHELGLFVGLIAFWLAVATGFGIKFFQRFLSLRQMLVYSLYLVFIGLVLSIMFCVWQRWGNVGMWLSAVPTAVGDVIAYSCLITLYSDVVSKEEQGKVMGICFVVVALIWSLTALVGGMVMSISPLLPLIIAPFGILFSILSIRNLSNI